MTIRNSWAAIIPALWLSASICVWVGAWPSARAAGDGPRTTHPSVSPAPISANGLAGLVRAYRESPSAARRAAVEGYAAAHPAEAHLAALALGVAAYEQGDWPSAAAWLRKARPKLAPIADYLAYYTAAARLEMADDRTAVLAELAPVRTAIQSSPVSGKAWLVEARARRTAEPAAAVRNRVETLAFERGLMVLGCGENSIRLCPPLIVSEQEATVALDILEESIALAEKEHAQA